MEKVDKIQKEQKTLQEKVAKLKTKLNGKTLLQGAKHSLWDTLVVDITKFKKYLNFFGDKNVVAIASLLKYTIVNEILLRRYCEKTQNVINFLNSTSNVQLQTLGVKDRISIIVWDRKIIENHKHMRNVRVKVEQMH